MAIVKDFWAEPSYASLLQASQKRVHDYVVAGKGTAKEALDGLVKDWTEVFQDDGKMLGSRPSCPICKPSHAAAARTADPQPPRRALP